MEPQDLIKYPASEVKAVVVNGQLIPDANTVRSMLWTLSQTMKSNPELAELFRSDPLKVLGSLGLSAELQVEAAQSFGVEIPEGSCVATCACTGCCVTS
jgi:hypothetical protein